MNIRLPKLGPRIGSLLLAGFMSITATPLAMAEPETVTDAIRAQLIKAGMLPGYLDSSNMPSGIAFLPPPPVTDSAAERADRDANSRILSSSTPDRLALARVDADTRFPQAPQPFACTLGIEINENSTPAIYRLMKRTFMDFGLVTLPVKRHFNRPRPFMVNGQASCTPAEEERLRADGSYPSGHSAYGFGWGLVLASIAPERTDALLKRGIDFGTSREVCNVHWHSDVEQGRILAAAVFSRLQANAEFRDDLERARNEFQIARSRNVGPPAECGSGTSAENLFTQPIE